MEVYGRVYLLVDMTNGLCYVGQTRNTIDERFQEHCYATTLIGKAIRENGRKNFNRHLLKECMSQEELDYWEIFLIATLGTKEPNGYNRTDGGDTIWIPTPKECSKFSVTQRAYTPLKNLEYEIDAVPTTYEKISKLMGHSSHKYLGRKMCGERRFTEADKIWLSNYFGKSIEYLFEGEPEFKTPEELHMEYSEAYRDDSPFKNLLYEMKILKLSYTKLAKLMGYKSHQSISNKMRGKTRFTDNDKIKLVEIFSKPIEYLLTTDGSIQLKDWDEVCVKMSEKNRHDSLFKNLLHEMKIFKLSYIKLAKLMGYVTHASISYKMRGIQDFTDNDKIKLVEIFRKPIEYLLARDAE